MSDALYEKFVQRWEEVTDIPPQTLGPLTPLYKKVSKRLKVMPWPALLALSVALVGGLYLLSGPAIIRLVSLLQRGF